MSEMRDEAQVTGLYVTEFGGAELLVTVFDDGTADLAFRADPRFSWGPPVTMERRPHR